MWRKGTNIALRFTQDMDMYMDSLRQEHFTYPSVLGDVEAVCECDEESQKNCQRLQRKWGSLESINNGGYSKNGYLFLTQDLVHKCYHYNQW